MKDNENPTIYSVTNSRDKEFYNKLIAKQSLSRLNFNPIGLNTLDPTCIPTSIERSVQLAITSIEKNKGEKEYDSLSLLRISGMLPESESVEDSPITEEKKKMELPSIYDQCYFLPAKDPISASPCSPEEPNRDPIEPEEIFDIIRNIQDPEHPLTLEQLNVVNLDHIAVKDVPFTEDNPDDFSSVDVRFT